ncbi:MAG TPA: hypothetical protein VK713_06480 [Actinomycetes bacterium]|nr:hypothetical protein [Actinomycetes bacterium]
MPATPTTGSTPSPAPGTCGSPLTGWCWPTAAGPPSSSRRPWGPRWYFARQDIRVELLDGYPEPRHDAQGVGGRVAFFDEHVDLEVDGQPQPRPRTPWAAPRWWERMADLEARI